MKHLFLSLLLLQAWCASAQISYQQAGVAAPPPAVRYDSSMSLQVIPLTIDTASLVGQELTFLQLNPGYTGNRNFDDTMLTRFTTSRNGDKAYKGAFSDGRFYTPYRRALADKTFKIANCAVVYFDHSEKEEHKRGYFSLELVDADNHHFYYMLLTRDQREAPAFINGNLAWMKQRYPGHKLYGGRERYDNYKVVNILHNNDEMILDKDAEFTCTGIAFLFSPDQRFGRPYIVANYKDGIPWAIGRGSQELYKKAPVTGMLLEQDKYDATVAAENAAREKEEASKLAEAKRTEAETKEWNNTILKKFGPVQGKKIMNREVALGMTQEMCMYAWGAPNSRSTINSAGQVIEIYIYAYNKILKFNNNKLIGIVQ